MQILTTVILAVIAVVLFGFVIFFHELGHFLLAKASGIRVNEFSIGMGPALFKFGRGETQYSLRLLPIGGYCAMEGEDEDSDDPRAFGSKSVWKRMLVVVAGGMFNILLGVILTFFTLLPQDMFGTPVIARFEENSVFEAAGAQAGDRIVSVDGYAVYSDSDLYFGLALADLENVHFTVKRGSEKIDLPAFAMPTVIAEDGSEKITVDFYIVGEERNVLNLLSRSVTDTVSNVRIVFASLKGILTGRFGLNDMTGPVGTAQAITQMASTGLQNSFGNAVGNILSIIILITVNLGIVNLLPLPALDGGRLLFLLWEAVTRKPVPAKYEGYVHAAGFVLLIGLMVVVTFNDILRIFRGGF